jgi:hypothetical protein
VLAALDADDLDLAGRGLELELVGRQRLVT